MREHQLYGKLKKCESNLAQVIFLGPVISKEGMKVDLQKVKIILEWPRPINIIEIRNFLNLVGYCRRIMKVFSKTSLFFSNQCVDKDY